MAPEERKAGRSAGRARAAGTVGTVVGDLEISRAWLVDPYAGREGPGDIVVERGVITAVTWLTGAAAKGIGPDGVVVAPGFIDLHAHLREPGFEDAETVATGLAAAAHGGFTRVCAMPNTSPATDDAGVVGRVRSAAAASGSPVALDVIGAVPGARLHLTHLSTAAALDLVRHAKAAALPVTCDVTPHHLALTDEWVAGARRWAWEAVDADGAARDPWTDGALVAGPYDPACRVNPPLRDPVDAAAVRAALRDGTADAVVTDHAPHTVVDKEVEFGLAANGISGIETALGVLLAAVDAGELTLPGAIVSLTAGPARLLGLWAGRPAPAGLVEGAPADLVVFDRGERWTVTREALRSRGKNTPLAGRDLPGRVLLTVAAGRVAFTDLE